MNTLTAPLRLALAAAAAVAAGCAPDDPLEAVDPSGQSITLWHQHTGDHQQVLRTLIDGFNRSNEHGITVTEKYAGSYGDIYNQMPQAFGSGAPPDLVVAYSNQAHPYYLSGWVVDLGPYVKSPRWGLSDVARDDYFTAFLEQDEVDGVQVAFPPHRSMEVLYSNADWLEELGVDEPPASWDELARLCRLARQRPFSKTAGDDPVGLVLDVDASRLAAMVFSRGGRFLRADGRAYTLDTPEMRASLELLLALENEGTLRLFPDEADLIQSFADGRALFALRSSSDYPDIYDAVEAGPGFFVTVASPPFEGNGPIVNIYGASLAVSKTTPERQLASWLFIRWFTEPAQQARWVEATNYYPVRRGTAREYAPYLRTSYKLLDTGRSEPSGVWYDPVRRMLADAMVDVLDGGDVDRILSRVEWEANNLMGMRK